MTARLTQEAKTWLKTAAKLGFAALLIFWMFRQGALDLQVLKRLASPMVILVCAACIFFQIFINNYRWLTLLRGQGFESSVRQTLPLSFIGMFFNFFMPGGVGGDVVKGYYLLQDHPRQKFAGAISIFMDRMMGFFIMIATAFLALVFNWDHVSHSNELKSVAMGVSALFLCFFVFFFFSLSRTLQRSSFGYFLFEKLPGGRKLRALYDALHSYRKAPGALFGAAALSGINQFFLIGFVYAVGEAIGMNDIPISAYFFLVPVATVVTALPISPAGIGVGQVAFLFLFKFYLGRETPLGPTAATAIQLFSFAWGLVGAIFYLQRKKPNLASVATETTDTLAG